jgi:flagellar biosynthetic protein FliR
VNLSIATAELTALLLASVRAAAWLVISPPFNSQGIPAQMKALLSVAIAVPVVPTLIDKVPSTDSPLFLVSIVEQAVIGAALGFLTSMLFAAVQAAGNLVDLFGGFSVAFAFDPLGASGNTGGGVFGRFYNTTALALLFATDGHQLVLRGFTESYKALPLSGDLSMHTMQNLVTNGVATMFLASIQIAGPLIAVLFCTDIGLGLLSRIAPSLNAFSMGFPAKILLTLTGAGIAITLLPGVVSNTVDQAVQAVLRALGR